MKRQRRAAWTPGFVLATVSLVGVAGFLYPFLLPVSRAAAGDQAAHLRDAPFLFAIVTGLCLVAMLLTISEGQGGVAQSKTVALLGVLVALDATLRLAPSILGASPIFFLIILVGYVFGPALGFQMGALTLLLSGFITGGVGPWLPYQMLGCGWMGLTAGWLPKPASMRARLLLLALFSAAWGLLFGAILNLWFWPFSAPGAGTDASLYWAPGLSAGETLARYVRFYVVTSLVFDLFRAVGGALVVLALGAPVLRLLERYRARFAWQPFTWLPAAGDMPGEAGDRLTQT